jgi:hypothetical protein
MVEIELDRKRYLKLRLEDIREVERRLGGSFVDLNQTASFSFVTTAMWAALRADDPRITIQFVDSILESIMEKTGKALHEIAEPLAKAILESGIYGKENPGNEPAAEVVPTVASMNGY